MSRRSIGWIVAIVVLGLAAILRAQPPNPLIGAWERISFLDADGATIQPPAPAAFVIFSADGFYSQTGIPVGRPKIDKPLEQMTKEELVQRFNRLGAMRGAYTIAGNRLTRKEIAHANPNNEGDELVQLFRIEGDVLILSRPDPTHRGEARFRRAR